MDDAADCAGVAMVAGVVAVVGRFGSNLLFVWETEEEDEAVMLDFS